MMGDMPPRNLAPADVLLTDGRVGVVRRLVPEDAEELHDLHGRVSDDTLRLRFFSATRAAAHQYVEHVLSAADTLAMVAEVDGHIVGLATAEPVRPRTSEIAFLVADDFRGQGLGTLLLEHLAALARDQGIRRFEADVLSENARMLSVFSDAGFDVSRRSDQGEVIVELRTTATPDAAGRRRRARVRRRGPVARASAQAAVRGAGGCAQRRHGNRSSGAPVGPGGGLPRWAPRRPSPRGRVGRPGHAPVHGGDRRPRRPRRHRGSRSRRGLDASRRGGRWCAGSGGDLLGFRGARRAGCGDATGARGGRSRQRDPAGRPQLPGPVDQRPRRTPQRHVQRGRPAGRRPRRRQPVRRRRHRARRPRA